MALLLLLLLLLLLPLPRQDSQHDRANPVARQLLLLPCRVLVHRALFGPQEAQQPLPQRWLGVTAAVLLLLLVVVVVLLVLVLVVVVLMGRRPKESLLPPPLLRGPGLMTAPGCRRLCAAGLPWELVPAPAPRLARAKQLLLQGSLFAHGRSLMCGCGWVGERVHGWGGGRVGE